MIETKINFGVLGTANIALRSVIPALLNLKNNFNLVGIASRNIDGLEEICSKFNAKPYLSYEKLIEDDDIEAVYIPLPNGLHAEWISKALLKGKHVLVEKSLACSMQEVLDLTELAKERNLVLLENFQFRFHPQLEVIKNILQENSLGELRCLRASFGFPPFADSKNIRYQRVLGGGALLDAGAYTTKISQLILGNNLQVKAASLNTHNNSEVDIWGGAYLQCTDTGVFSELAFGFDHFYQCGIEIWGSEGKLRTNRLFTAPPNYEPEIFLELKDGSKTIKAPSANHFELMLKYFYKLVNGLEDKTPEYIQNVDQARLINDIKLVAHVK